MKTMRTLGTAMTVLIALAMGVRTGTANGADGDVVKPPATLWNFLGIPQGAHKIQDAIVNPRGNHPKWERKPALKQIADPANLKSPNLAIKAAAKIKADADLAPQKIKAIKYLATVCCGCAKNKDDVKDALVAALDDCTEDVRYEAAIAFCECAGNPCTVCNGSGCCDAKVMNKLLKVSEGKDDQGCWLEPSARVRAAAANALGACRQVRGPTTPEKTEAPRKGEGPRAEPGPTAVPDGKPAEPKGPAGSSTADDEGVAPAGFVEIQDGAPTITARDGEGEMPALLRLVPPSVVSTAEVRFQGRIVPSATPAPAPTTR